MVFYEGGQHITPTPFGVMPTYENALLDIQRDTSMYNMYMEWYAFMKTLQSGTKPLQLMNFSFISSRSAQYGSWGILETMAQDTAVIKAPKYAATIKNMAKGGCLMVSTLNEPTQPPYRIEIFPNPTCNDLNLKADDDLEEVTIIDAASKTVYTTRPQTNSFKLSMQPFPAGVYILNVSIKGNTQNNSYKVIKN